MSRFLFSSLSFKVPSVFSTWSTPRLLSVMAPLTSPSRPVHWVLDWDGTITKHDSLDALVNISASFKPEFPTLDHWNRVTKAYLDDYTSTLAKLAPGGALPQTIEEEKLLLERLQAVEQRSLDRVSESGIFKGLTKEQLNKGANTAINSKQVQVRVGYKDLFHHIHRHGDNFNILSVNWSRYFITACLSAAGAELPLDSIHANELEGVPQGRSSNGHISPDGEPKIISSGDKLRCLEQLRKSTPVAGESLPIIYVGDSWTDIECLLAADLGICIRDDPMGSSQRKLADALERLGVQCLHLKDWDQADPSRIVWASSFDEIRAWAERR